MPRKRKAQEALTETRSDMSQLLIPENKKEEQEIVNRPTALDFEKAKKIKELILQDIRKGRTQSVMQYTKSLVNQYIQNPAAYRSQIIGVSRFLWRVSTIYKKIIFYYATMPKYNYCIVEHPNFTKPIDKNKMLAEYEKVLLHCHRFNFKEEFATAVALAIRDGVYCGYMYDFENDGSFLHMLPVEYYKIRGKNEAGQWVVAFDLTYFSFGQNVIFVEGIDGDMSGCWAQEFIDGWKAYLSDRQKNRWLILDPSKTIVLLGGLQDEFDHPLPYLTGLFPSILNMLAAEELVADKTELDNFYLLLLQIDTFDENTVDDFEISLELAEAYKDAVASIMPRLAGVALLPGMKADLQTFNKANSNNDESIIEENINNIFAQSGASQTVVSSGNGQSALSIKYSLINDFSYVALLLSRLESNYQYYIDKNISENTIFTIHHQTHYNEDEYLEKLKTSATLGGSAMKYLTAMNMTPYEAYCTILFESAIGLKEMMEPLESSYQKSANDNDVGRPRVSDDEISDSAERTRNIVDEN